MTEALQTLTFRQPSMWRQTFELMRNDAVIGDLKISGWGGGTAQVRLDDLAWTITRVGMLQTNVLVTTAGTNEPVVNYTSNILSDGGSATLNGQVLQFASRSWLGNRHEWRNEAGDVLVSYTKRGFLRAAGTIEVQPAIWHDPALRVLAPLGIYLCLQQSRDTSSAASNSAAISG